MPSKGYSVNTNDHKIKDMLNRRILSKYAGYHSKNAVILPSITCNDIRICHEFRIFDVDTRFLAFERGCCDRRGNSIKPVDFFPIVESKFNSIFGCKRILNRYCETKIQDIRDSYFGAERRNINKFDFANYDTCSYPYGASDWFLNHVGAFKSGAPILFTFDADYTNRDGTSINGRMVRNTVEWHGIENLESYNHDLLMEVEKKCRRVAWELCKCGLLVDSLHCYKEDSLRSKVMMVISAVKK